MSNHQPKLDLNVLPESYRRRWLSIRQLAILVAMIVAILLTFFFFWATSKAMDKTADLKGELAQLNQQIELRKVKLNERNDMLKAVTEYQIMDDKQGIIAEDVEAIYSAAEGMSFQVASVSHKGGKVVVSCEANVGSPPEDYSELIKTFDNYCKVLKQREGFSSATHNLKAGTPTGPIPVEVTIEVKRAETAASK